jgi:serine/threonine protein kinase
MSTEPRQVTKPVAWTAWENQVVNGVFPLRRFLGTSRHGVVFLTEYQSSDATIKLVPVDASRADAQVAQWEAAASISHPHLVRVFEVGRCQLGGRGFAFVVMEYAEQTLAQILARRALTAEEARELLPPALNALACLHGNHLVHGQLKPSNILAVNDQLKLSSDTIRPAGHAESGVVRTSLYDPPELREGTISAAGDMWALGMALVEALTQRTWAGSRGQGETTTSLLSSLPSPFAETARRCLSRAPADRPTAAELEAQYRPAPPPDEVISDAVLSAPPPPSIETPRASEPPEPTETQQAAQSHEETQAHEGAPSREAVEAHDVVQSPQATETHEVVQSHASTEVDEIVQSHAATEVDEIVQSHAPTEAQETPQAQEATEPPHQTDQPPATTETQAANEAQGESAASQNLSLASLSLRAIAGALLLFLGAWAILRS